MGGTGFGDSERHQQGELCLPKTRSGYIVRVGGSLEVIPMFSNGEGCCFEVSSWFSREGTNYTLRGPGVCDPSYTKTIARSLGLLADRETWIYSTFVLFGSPDSLHVSAASFRLGLALFDGLRVLKASLFKLAPCLLQELILTHGNLMRAYLPHSQRRNKCIRGLWLSDMLVSKKGHHSHCCKVNRRGFLPRFSSGYLRSSEKLGGGSAFDEESRIIETRRETNPIDDTIASLQLWYEAGYTFEDEGHLRAKQHSDRTENFVIRHSARCAACARLVQHAYRRIDPHTGHRRPLSCALHGSRVWYSGRCSEAREVRWTRHGVEAAVSEIIKGNETGAAGPGQC
ncbi:uncharacterized protein FOMMEDRAFT_154759 [Fomitiporia mediterranea MF3/22]|uniref:uncharacterized protein n=1 Tax=Fomitiporia mediterranea (strain MF3/22) TaxID=694068 RepID=UPI0004409390|nr:uncharacterized protein FOMMEDRAFT_154759 [Fomitiporia mediterranea MF3/22]EJD03655.1 hypothetical protein FOMMEDRAFT_154759 [Fomitiporia mediterranea MF3/22]